MKLNLIAAALLFGNFMETSRIVRERGKEMLMGHRGRSQYDQSEQFVNEEYSHRIYVSERALRASGSNKDKNKNVSSKKDKNKSKSDEKTARNTHFNTDVESQSDTSSVADEYPKIHPSVTFDNATYADSISGRRIRHMFQLQLKSDELKKPCYVDDSDVIAAQVKPLILYSANPPEFDGHMGTGLIENRNHLWRNPNFHPEMIYVNNNEINPKVSVYDVDPDTSQKEFSSHMGRRIGRDEKAKTFPNRNSHSSVNDGCAIC